MNHVVSASELNERRDRYYMDQQVGAYGIVLSIALGVAGLAAASLFFFTPADRPFRLIFWALWLTSLAGVAVVYSGMNVNAFALPNRVPDLLDIFSPFLMALLEFTLFAVLTRPLTNQISPRSVVALWFGCFGLFGCAATLVISHAKWLFQRTDYEEALKEPIDQVIRKLAHDRLGAASCALIAAGTAIFFEFAHSALIYTAYPVAAIMMAGLIASFFSHNEQRKALESGLTKADVATEEKTPESAAESYVLNERRTISGIGWPSLPGPSHGYGILPE